MNELLLLVIKSLYFILPAYFANMIPVLVKKNFRSLAKPIDGGLKLGGKPLLGKNKTWRGLIFAVLIGIVIFCLQRRLYLFGIGTEISLIDYSQYNFLFGALLGFGAIFGDLFESFFKRRFNINPGKPWIPFDQLDFIVFALLFSCILYVPSWKVWAILMVITPFVHLSTNYMGYALKIKKNKW